MYYFFSKSSGQLVLLPNTIFSLHTHARSHAHTRSHTCMYTRTHVVSVLIRLWDLTQSFVSVAGTVVLGCHSNQPAVAGQLLCYTAVAAGWCS